MSGNGASNAGGAATHAGVDFQQRLAAWFAVAMLARLDVSPTLAAPMAIVIEGISMETADCVDDIVLHCASDLRVFVQAKTSPSLFVATFDFDDSGSDARSAYVMLSTSIRLKSPPDLVWSKLIQVCLDASRRRLRISRDGIMAALARYIDTTADESISSEELVEFTQTGEIAAGMEVVLMERPDTPDRAFVFGMRRFDESGQSRLVFTDGKLTIASGEYKVLSRSATLQGIERFLDMNRHKFADKEIVVAMANVSEDPNLGDAARSRAQWIKDRVKPLAKRLVCLECGATLDARIALFVEVDEQNHEHEVGVVHVRCVRPLHRVLGQIKQPFFDEHKHLEDFDVASWINLIRNGQGMLSGLRKMRDLSNAVIVWNPDPAESTTRYCVRVTLESGARPTVMRRGKVHRFSHDDAIAAATKLNDMIEAVARHGDAHMMSEDGLTFGNKSKLEHLAIKDAVSRCIAASAELYTRTLAEKFDVELSYYTPLIAIRVGDEESYFRIGNACVLLSDLLAVEAHFANWASAGVILPKHYLELVADDNAFDVLMSRNDAEGCTAHS